MRFALLGPLQVWDGDRAVELGPARRRALLAALLVDVGEPVWASVLADRVWDGAPPASATSTLHAYVSRLRSTLASAEQGDPAIVRTTPGGYLLDISREDLDASRFRDGLARARRIADSGSAATAREAIADALRLWRGRAFADVPGEFAVLPARSLDELRLSGLELAARLDLELGREAVLVDELDAVVRTNPLHEPLRAALMLGLYRSGRAADALRVFAEGREVLADQIGADSGGELVELHTRILRQDPALLVRTLAAAGPDPAPGADAAPGVPTRSGLIGRSRETEQLVREIAAVEQDGPRFIAVSGEAGIGKSRLVDEVARASGVRSAWGRSWQHEESLALWPWIQVLRALEADRPGTLLSAARTGRGAVLAGLLAELPSVEGATPETSELRVLDAVLVAIEIAASAGPVLLVLDDAQWADPTSRRMLEFAAARLVGRPVAILVTLRTPGGASDAASREILAVLASTGRLRSVGLRGLDPAQTAALVEGTSGSRIDGAELAALHERTAGNPFFVAELARLTVAGDREAMTRIPDTVRGAVRRRLDQLPIGALPLLEVAALAGRTFDLGLVAAVGGLDDEAADEAADIATSFGMLVSEPGAAGEHRFAHALIQETLVEDLGSAHRRRIHRRYAEELEGRRRAGPSRATLAERIAQHLAAAGGQTDLRRAIALLLSAIDDPLDPARFIGIEQKLLLAAGLAARVTGSDGDELRSKIDTRLQVFRMITVGPSAMLPVADALIASVSADGVEVEATPLERLTALQLRWGVEMVRARLDECERTSAELLRTGDRLDDDSLRLGGWAAAGSNALQRGDFAQVVTAMARVEQLLGSAIVPPELYSPHPAVGAPAWSGIAIQMLEGPDGASARFALARQRAAALGDPVADAYLSGIELWRWVFADEPQQALRSMTVLPAEPAADIEVMRVFTDPLRAWVIAHEDPRRGLALGEAAVNVFEGFEQVIWRPAMRTVLAEILLLAGRPEQALALCDRALDESTAIGTPLMDVRTLATRIRALRRLDAAETEITATRDRGRRIARAQQATLFSRQLDRA